MSFRRWIAAVFVAVVSVVPFVSAAEPPAAPAPGGPHRIDLPGSLEEPFPYTVELPGGWQLLEVKGIPGIWLGPSDAQPPNDPRLIYVRISPTSVADPAQTVANIRAADAKQPWSAPLVEVREVGGIRGVLVRMDSGEGDAVRSTLVLKLPLPVGGVDFMATAPRSEFEKLRPVYEKVFFSVRPRVAGG